MEVVVKNRELVEILTHPYNQHRDKILWIRLGIERKGLVLV